MPSLPHNELTRLLSDTRIEDKQAIDRLWPEVYDELREIAHRQLQHRGPGRTYRTTALVHEAYLKLVDQTQATWHDRLHFTAVSALAMRHILIDYARQRSRQKRGGDRHRVTLDDALLIANERAEMFLALDKALTKLAELNSRLAQVVELRFFGGMTECDMAHVLGVSNRTVRRDWRKAKAWLSDALAEPP